jgi:predicted ATPase
MHRFRGKGLYILDEPEAALSPKRQLALLRRLRQLVQQDSQFIIATHSPILLAYPNARILVLDEQGYRATPYQETEHYRISKSFLDDPSAGLKQAFEDGDDLVQTPENSFTGRPPSAT